MFGHALVIDDDAAVRALITCVLENAGWKVTAADGGAAGVAAARAALPDVVLCDLRMPDMDGTDVVRALTADPVTAGTPIVLVSSDRATGSVVSGIAAGAHDYVHKPFEPVELLTRSHAALRVGQERRRLERAERELRLVADQYRVSFDRAPVAMAHVGLDGRFLEVNQAMCDLFCYRAEGLIGASVKVLDVPRDEETRADAAIAGPIRNQHIEKLYRRADGDLVWVAESATAIRGAGGDVTHLLVHYLDITDRKQTEDELRHLADHDPLTDLLNRRGFERELGHHVALAERYGGGGAVLVLDIDRFKAVNDTLGHAAGDEAIVAVADVLRRRLRASDVVARLGGDEFAVLLPRATPEQAEIVAASLVESVRGSTSVTTSVGVAIYGPGNVTATAALSHADAGLYAAKAAGRDGYAFSTAA